MGSPARASLALPPRGLTREQAAAYCNLTPSGFDRWVAGVKRGGAPPERADLADRHDPLSPALDHLIRGEPLQSARQPRDAAIGQADGRVDELDGPKVHSAQGCVASR